MRTICSALFLAAAAPALAQSAPGGTVRSDRATLEVVPPRAGASEIRTPEGFIRVESGVIGGGAASFGVYQRAVASRPAPTSAAAPPRSVQAPEGVPNAPPVAPPLDPCRAERSRYVKRLLYMSGIVDVPEPLDFLEGLAGTAQATGPLLFTEYGQLPGIDPIRALAWDLELKSIARELADCRRQAAP